MHSLAGKTALVTGASSGIGLAIAERLAAEGAHVYLAGRRKAQLDKAVTWIGAHAVGIQADVTNPRAVDALYERVEKDGRRLDVVVANAGDGGFARPDEITPEHLDRTFGTNVYGTIFTVQKALPLLNDGAAVILLSSVTADIGSEAFGIHAAAKAAIRSLGRTWADELKGRGIRVNTISTGAIDTAGETAAAPGPSHPEEFFSAIYQGVPLGPVGTAEAIASAAVFLATSESGYITGSNLFVEGGRHQL